MEIEIGRQMGVGLRFAACGEYRILAFESGGYSRNRWKDGRWRVMEEGDAIPLDVEKDLRKALRLKEHPCH